MKEWIRPPIKTQGIKLKVLPQIKNIYRMWNEVGWYYEPFAGSCSVVFNLAPQKAVIGDTNPHIIKFYRDLFTKKFTFADIEQHLRENGKQLAATPNTTESYYYVVRERFNKKPNSLDFLFLNRTAFNGVIRYNKKGEFNTPFCRIPTRFSNEAFLTRVLNQVQTVYTCMQNKQWYFVVQSWQDTLENIAQNDFTFFDPPYCGLNTQYYNNWTYEDFIELENFCYSRNFNFLLTMWLKKHYVDRDTKTPTIRYNSFMEKHWQNLTEILVDHKYMVGQNIDNRPRVVESLRYKIND